MFYYYKKKLKKGVRWKSFFHKSCILRASVNCKNIEVDSINDLKFLNTRIQK